MSNSGFLVVSLRNTDGTVIQGANSDDRLNGLPAFEQFSFLLRHAFKLAAVLDV